MRTIEDIQKANQVFLYGIGAQCLECYKYCTSKSEVILVDGNQKKWGTEYRKEGKFIISPEEMLQRWDNYSVVVISSIYNQYEIGKNLIQMGIAEKFIFSYISLYYNTHVYDAKKIIDNKDRISNIYRNILKDKESKEYYLNSVKVRLFQNPIMIPPNSRMERIGEYGREVELKEGDTIVDCGAYTGDTAEIYMKRLNGNARIFAIEPFKSSYQMLCRKIEDRGWGNKVTPYHCGVSEQPGETGIHYNEDELDVGMRLNRKGGGYCQKVTVETLDNLFSKDRVNYIKMDIEGEEAKALEGGRDMIQRCRPKMLISAYHKVEDLWELPELILSINGDYSIYAGHAPGISMEIEFYCIDKLHR